MGEQEERRTRREELGAREGKKVSSADRWMDGWMDGWKGKRTSSHQIQETD